MSAHACCEREWDEREAGQQRARPEDVLEIDRAEIEEPEDRSCCGEHQEEPSADCTIAEPPNLEKRRLGARFEDGERREPDETDKSEAERLRRGPACARALGDRKDDRAEACRCDDRAPQIETAPTGLL